MPTVNWRYIFLLIISHGTREAISNCPPDSLAVYEVHLETLWDRKDFPKQYPQWRPPASWSKMIGFSHDSTFHVFHKGDQASEALLKFAETARSDLFDSFTQGSLGVFDRYSTPPISTGVGDAKVLIMADGNHTKISMVCKLIPSPDWFIGVDTYDLCPNGRWLEYVHLESGPLDAGTDNGLTFTSPNWPTKPQENIQPITSHHPNHQAGSFYYPQSDELPPIAQFTIKKQREFSLRETFDAADGLVADRRDIYRYEVGDQKIASDSSYVKILRDKEDDYSQNIISNDSRKPHSSKKVESTKVFQSNHINHPYKKKLRNPQPTTKEPDFTEVTEPGLKTPIRTSTPLSTTPEKEGTRSRKGSNGTKNGRKRIPGGDVMSVIGDIVKDYQIEHRQMIRKRKQERKRRRQQLKKIKPPRDCRVSEWAEWSLCSKTCGIGEQSRTREIIKHAKREGKPCPVLVETTWCGSARACKRDYFNWE